MHVAANALELAIAIGQGKREGEVVSVNYEREKQYGRKGVMVWRLRAKKAQNNGLFIGRLAAVRRKYENGPITPPSRLFPVE